MLRAYAVTIWIGFWVQGNVDLPTFSASLGTCGKVAARKDMGDMGQQLTEKLLGSHAGHIPPHFPPFPTHQQSGAGTL